MSLRAIHRGARRFSMRDLPTGTSTLLFTDIEGSTHLLQQLGDRYAELLTECLNLLRATFQKYSGYEVDTQGDAIFTVFARDSDALLAAVASPREIACPYRSRPVLTSVPTRCD